MDVKKTLMDIHNKLFWENLIYFSFIDLSKKCAKCYNHKK